MKNSGGAFRHFTVSFLLFAFIPLAGCAPGSHGLKPPNAVPPLTVEEVIGRIKGARKTVYSLKGMAKVKISAGDIDTTVNEVVAVKRPSSVRLETLGFFGPVTVFVSDGKVFSMTTGDRCLSGSLTASSFEILPFPFNLLRMDEIATILLGSVPIMGFEDGRLDYSDTGGVYTLTIHSIDGSKRQTIWVDAGTMRLVRSEIRDDSLGSLLSVAFGMFQDIGGASIPKEITVETSPPESTLHIQYGDMELNPAIEDDLFLLSPLKGATIR